MQIFFRTGQQLIPLHLRCSSLALAIAATILEGPLDVLLLVGLFTRSAAVAASLLLLSFAGAMRISLGIKSVLDYSVLSALCGALFFAAEDRYPLRIDALLSFEFGDHHHESSSNNERDS